MTHVSVWYVLNSKFINRLYSVLFIFKIFYFRYLTESYGTGQDIDDRIVEGIVDFYFLIRYIWS